MPAIYPFVPVQYAQAVSAKPGTPADLSALIAPPYDVLDQPGKDGLLARSEDNIVAIDLPHLPAKDLGPDIEYASAGLRLRAKLQEGVFVKRAEPVMFVYRQTFEYAGSRHQRTGVVATLDIAPFGPGKDGRGGILPHEQTFSGPKQDRLALMQATGMQISPIFGLVPDEHHNLARRVAHIAGLRPAEVVGTTDDGCLHELWAVHDEGTLAHLTHDLAGQDVLIADGHHRYTTAMTYLEHLQAGGKKLPADHPARRCMFVLVSLHDPGLVIGPTHRVLAGIKGYSWHAFERASKGHLHLAPVHGGLGSIEHAIKVGAKKGGKNVLGLYDFATGTAHLCTPTDPDPLKGAFPDKPHAWRTLDVAICQHLIVEQIAQAKLNGGQPVQWAFPHSVADVDALGRGEGGKSGVGADFEPQLGVILDPTPLTAVRAVCGANELMPQKSTYFYPKLATGLFMFGLS